MPDEGSPIKTLSQYKYTKKRSHPMDDFFERMDELTKRDRSKYIIYARHRQHRKNK